MFNSRRTRVDHNIIYKQFFPRYSLYFNLMARIYASIAQPNLFVCPQYSTIFQKKKISNSNILYHAMETYKYLEICFFFHLSSMSLTNTYKIILFLLVIINY